MEQIEILETIIVLLCVVVGALVIGMIAIMVSVREQEDKIDSTIDIMNKQIYDLKVDMGNARMFYSSELTRKQQDIDNLYRNKKDKSKEDIILEEIEKNRETLEKNINDRLNK